jgi:putative spermidine/putrescine transport system ATP-binding protein
MTTVEFVSVTKEFGPVRALSDVSLNVRSGEFATLLGPSGSGKTTALSLLSGIMQPTSGRMLIGGRDITDVPAAQRNIGLVFQSYALFPHMSVFENIAFPLRVRRRSDAEIASRVNEALALVRLEAFGKRRPHELSGGQQQRVALARAIVFKPDILLLDEPLAALDRKLREEVRAEIHQLQRRLGITTIMVTHDQDEALSMSDRIVVMDAGRVQQIDTPDSAYYRPNSRFVAGFLGLANFLDGEIDASSGMCAIRLDSGESITVAPTGGTLLTGRVCGIIRPEDVKLVNGSGGGMVEGTVREAVFFGDTVRYAVQLDSGLEMTAHVTGSRQRFAEGKRVELAWDPARVWLIPAEEASAGWDQSDFGRRQSGNFNKTLSGVKGKGEGNA